MRAIALRDTPAEADCERVLRSLPRWFGIEPALQDYVRDTTRLPTLLCRLDGELIGFATLVQHFPAAFELHCLAVHAAQRGQGHGRALLRAAEDWAAAAGGRFLQIKTIAAAHRSTAYAETRLFYEAMGYTPLEVFPTLWGAHNPCLQLVKALG